MMKAVSEYPHEQNKISRKCAREGIKINKSDDTIVLDEPKQATKVSDDVRLCWNTNKSEVVIVSVAG